MGGTTNATDNFNISPETATQLEAEAAHAEGHAHVHGPGCGHDHSHEHSAPVAQGKYATVADIPDLDIVASFNTNNEGPIWKTTPQAYLTNLAFQAANVPPGGVKVCIVNNEAYKFLLSMRDFQQRLEPSLTIERVKAGVIGLFAGKVILATDALWDPKDQFTLHKAMYFCDEVVANVVEVTIETTEAQVATEA